MTDRTVVPARRGERAGGWPAAWITPRAELSQLGRMSGTAVRLTAQIFLSAALWRALYADVDTHAGLSRDQAVTYAVLAVLATQVRGLNRSVARDSVLQHVQTGTILYWFLRPVPPRRYYFVRAVGDQLYGSAWVLAGYLVCLGAGVVAPPASASAAALSAVSFVLGQIVMYYLLLLVDLLSFWTLQNQSSIQILRFLQNLMSGVIAPLWFFPGWFLALSEFLPFRGTLHVPVSIYVGRIAGAGTTKELGVQVLWCLLLAALTGALWRRAAAQITVQGG
jgi:ABC-2 type transport system permease protein